LVGDVKKKSASKTAKDGEKCFGEEPKSLDEVERGFPEKVIEVKNPGRGGPFPRLNGCQKNSRLGIGGCSSAFVSSGPQS